MLPDIVVKVIEHTEPSVKLELVKELIPKYINAEIVPENDSRFRVNLLDWTGTCAYLATMSNPDKFLAWLKQKHKRMQAELSIKVPEIVNLLINKPMNEETIATNFKNNHALFTKIVKDNQEIISKGVNRDIVAAVSKKPSIFIWNTGKVQVNKVGISKL